MSAASRASQDVTAAAIVLSREALRVLLELHHRQRPEGGFNGVARVVVSSVSPAFINGLDELVRLNLITFVQHPDRPRTELWFAIPVELRSAP